MTVVLGLPCTAWVAALLADSGARLGAKLLMGGTTGLTLLLLVAELRQPSVRAGRLFLWVAVVVLNIGCWLAVRHVHAPIVD